MKETFWQYVRKRINSLYLSAAIGIIFYAFFIGFGNINLSYGFPIKQILAFLITIVAFVIGGFFAIFFKYDSEQKEK